MDNEPFSNPLAPPSLSSRADDSHSSAQPLTNDDFRKLMMTPRVVSSGSNRTTVPGSVRGSIRSKHSKPYNQKVETTENQKKKKKLYESIRKHEDEVLNELSKKYRDRAKERRDCSNSEYGNATDPVANTAYHAVGPDNFDLDATERRKILIQESKYLGGDMEHTHLVKGLDYALLQKVKAEIQTKEEEDRYMRLKREEEAKKEEEQRKRAKFGLSKLADISFDDKDRYAVKSKVAENILKAVFNTKLPEKNELFFQGRMAYQYDLVDEFPESDIPTTIIRSKAECPNSDAYNSISTNEIVINKLVQIWLFIRQGGANKKAKRPRMETKFDHELEGSEAKGDSIYDDIGDYVPSINLKHETHRKESSSKQKGQSYFETNKSDIHISGNEKRTSEQQALELAASVVGSFAATSDAISSIKSGKRKSNYQPEPDSYAECYPGAPENDDAVLDSDDEVDYTKMDIGTKKGTKVNRWDFDSVEEYGDYMSNREALPKAAFQYGVKMGDGRKPKRPPTRKEEKAKLDRDLQKINAIIAKRKQAGVEGGMSSYSKS